MSEPLLDPPYPGDESESEYQARRRKLLEDLSDDQIRDMVCDAMDDRFIGILKRLFVMNPCPKTPEYLTVATEFDDRLNEEVEKYLEAHE